jgi:ribosomal protein S8
MNATICDFLSSLKNASLSQKKFLIVHFNKNFLLILKILYKEGIILTYSKINTNIIIKLRYYYNISCLKRIKIVSTASKPVFLNKFEILKLVEKNKLLIFSTSRGFLTSLECKNLQIGGKFVFLC